MQHSSKLSPRQSETLFDDALPDSPEDFRDEVATLKMRKRRAHTRQRRWSVWLITGAFTLTSLLLMVTIFSVQAEHSRWRNRVAQRETELAVLEAQLKTGERRLAALQSPQGRQELLINNGYLKPGDRYLEFKEDSDESKQAEAPPNDLTPHPSKWDSSPVQGGSIWRGAWNSLSKKWQRLREGQ
jgi:hypothetical protein